LALIVRDTSEEICDAYTAKTKLQNRTKANEKRQKKLVVLLDYQWSLTHVVFADKT